MNKIATQLLIFIFAIEVVQAMRYDEHYGGSNTSSISNNSLEPIVRHTLSGHQSYITSVAISSDNSFIVTGSKDHTAKVWNVKTGELLHTLSSKQWV